MIAEPHPTSTDVDPTVVLAVFGTLAGAAVIFAAMHAIRTRDLVPLAACAGALVCALNEPIYDILGKIVYAPQNHIAYTNFDREIPWFLVVGYIPWVGLLPWWISRLMAGGTRRLMLHWIALGSFASVVLVETIGTSLEIWTYYGEPPLKYIGVAPQMAAMPLVGGLLLFVISTQVRAGAARAAAAFVAATLALPATYASVSWPLYAGLYADIPEAAEWVCLLATLGLAAATVVFVTSLVARIAGAESPVSPRSPA